METSIFTPYFLLKLKKPLMGGPSEAGGKFIVCTHNRIFYVLDNEVAFFISGSLLCHANE